jgi:hypothetical protein
MNSGGTDTEDLPQPTVDVSATPTVSAASPSPTAVTAQRFELVALDEGKYVRVGAVSVDGRYRFSIVGGPEPHRARLESVVKNANARDHDSVEAIPKGSRGTASRLIERDEPLFFALLRDWLLDNNNVVMFTKGTKPPPAVRVEQSGRSSVQYGGLPSFTEGEVSDVQVAGRLLRAATFAAYVTPARSTYLVVVWPDVEPSTKSHLVEHSLGSDKVLDARDVLAHESLGVAAQSLRLY